MGAHAISEHNEKLGAGGLGGVRRRRLLMSSMSSSSNNKEIDEAAKLQMSNACMAGCAHAGSPFSWMVNSSGHVQNYAEPMQRELYGTGAFPHFMGGVAGLPFYGPPVPAAAALLERQAAAGSTRRQHNHHHHHHQGQALQDQHPDPQVAVDATPAADPDADTAAHGGSPPADAADAADANTADAAAPPDADTANSFGVASSTVSDDGVPDDDETATAAATTAASFEKAALGPGASLAMTHTALVKPEGIFATQAPLTSCTMQCVNMGVAAMKEYDAAKKANKLPREAKETTPNDRLKMTYSCMAGCRQGTPFMFNWTNPVFPGNLNAWALSHDGSTGLLPTEVPTTPLDGGSCTMQCLAMGREAMAAWDRGVQSGDIKGFEGAVKTTKEDQGKMAFSCQHGCVAGTPFMFNWTHPAMPGDLTAYTMNPYLSNHPYVHPYWVKNKPKNHPACVMQCLSMGKSALDNDCLLNPKLEKCGGSTSGLSGVRRLRRRRLLMSGLTAPRPCSGDSDCKEKKDAAGMAMSASCMQGCSSGIPFMFNWTEPMMPGVPVAAPSTWLNGLGSIAGLDDSGLGTASLAPFNGANEIAKGPADHETCVLQCISMGHDAVKRHDEWVKDHAVHAKEQGKFESTPGQRAQIVFTCSRGCDAGTPFMFNFTDPGMPGLPVVPDDNKPFGSTWTAPLLPGLPPVPMTGSMMGAGHPTHGFYGNIYNFTHPFYPFMGHPNGAGGAFQSAAKGHMVCVVKQVKAYKADKIYMSSPQLTPEKARALADFLRPCQAYAMVALGPKMGTGAPVGSATTHTGMASTGFGDLKGPMNAPSFDKPSGADSMSLGDAITNSDAPPPTTSGVRFLERREGSGAKRRSSIQRGSRRSRGNGGASAGYAALMEEMARRQRQQRQQRRGMTTKYGGASGMTSSKPATEMAALTNMGQPGGLYLPAEKNSNVQLPPIPLTDEQSPLNQAAATAAGLASYDSQPKPAAR